MVGVRSFTRSRRLDRLLQEELLTPRKEVTPLKCAICGDPLWDGLCNYCKDWLQNFIVKFNNVGNILFEFERDCKCYIPLPDERYES